jgi:hypothetical protein
MPVFNLEPWQENTELEVCGAPYCFELKDKGHRVHVFYEEYGEKGGTALSVDLQKLDGYKEYVKRFVEFDLPSVPLDAPNELNGDFYTAYKSALLLYKEKKKVSIHTHWESDDIIISFTIMMLKRSVDVMLRVMYGPYRLYYDTYAATKKVEEEAERLVRNAIGLYLLFREYVKGRKPDQGVQEKA